MYVVVAKHKATGETHESPPISLGGINYEPNEREYIRRAIDMMRRDRTVDIKNPDDYQFEIVAC
jgi:hypothetical protein